MQKSKQFSGEVSPFGLILPSPTPFCQIIKSTILILPYLILFVKIFFNILTNFIAILNTLYF